MTGACLTIVLLYLVCTAYIGYRRMKKWQGSAGTETGRIMQYRFSLIWNAGTLLSVLLFVWLTPVGIAELGFRAIQFRSDGGVLLIAVLMLCGVLTVVFVWQIIAFRCSARYRKAMTETMQQRRETGGWYEKAVDSLIPRSRWEKRWFALTAVAAGACEEVVFRGFFLYLLGSVFPSAPWYLLAAIGGCLFGAAHFYQGAKGTIKTSLLGMLFGCLYLGTNSLILCVPLHMVFDLSSAFLYEQ